MATSKSTSKAKRPAARHSIKAREPAPAYGTPNGALSFYSGLKAKERATIERALAILGRELREREVFGSPDLVKGYLQLRMAGERFETFGALYLDSQNRAIAYETHFTGSVKSVTVHPREVVMAALAHRAAGLVLAHNHPSGNVQPSRSDEAVTQTMKAALELVEVRLLDHVIVARGAALSMAERGLI